MMAVRIPTLVLSGADTWPQLVVSSRAIADAVAVATHEVVPGGAQHDIPTDTTARIVRTALS